MDKRENFLRLLRRKGYNEIPCEFTLCPSLIEEFKKQTRSDLDYSDYFGMPWKIFNDFGLVDSDPEKFKKYYDFDLKPGTFITSWGIAHEPGSAAAKHMTRMRHPLKNITDLSEMQEYPFPDYSKISLNDQKVEIEKAHSMGLASVGQMPCTIWETSWYMRSMEELMMDMKSEDPMAEFLLDKVTEAAIYRAEAYVNAGVDILFLGDDIGMQSSTLMSEEFYVDWLKPRLKKVITAAKKINPEIIIFYHSCGYVEPFIPHLIDVGIDVLNPIQPECMSFEKIYKMYGDSLSFHGTIGTQTTMPFGTPEEVKREVYKNLEIAGSKGGLFVAPTHLLEPEVPWENIIAYVAACKNFTR